MKYQTKIRGVVTHNHLPVVLNMPLNKRVRAMDPSTKGPYLTLARYLHREQLVWSNSVHGWVFVHEVGVTK